MKTTTILDAKHGDVVKFYSQGKINVGSIILFTETGLWIEKWGQIHSKTFAKFEEVFEVLPKIS